MVQNATYVCVCISVMSFTDMMYIYACILYCWWFYKNPNETNKQWVFLNIFCWLKLAYYVHSDIKSSIFSMKTKKIYSSLILVLAGTTQYGNFNIIQVKCGFHLKKCVCKRNWLVNTSITIQKINNYIVRFDISYKYYDFVIYKS